MKLLEDFKIVFLLLLLVFGLVIVKISGKNHFKQDAQNTIETVVNNDFIVSSESFQNNGGEYLIVDFSEPETSTTKFEKVLHIDFEKLLDESTLHKLKDTENKILLVSSDNSVALKAWVILNQLEFENVFVLSNEETPEVLKYEFQRDTTAETEISVQSLEL